LFYKMFSAYYNSIFPLAGSKAVFFNNLWRAYKPKTALDLGCATGELVDHLTKQGCQATGVDMSSDLLALAHDKDGKFVQADMVEYLSQTPQQHDMVICIGNTLPHLKPVQLERFFSIIPHWLKSGGVLVVQTVNYHRILQKRPPGLSTINRPEEGLQFQRLYNYNEDGSIDFTAILTSPQGRDKATVTLWPFTHQKFNQALANTFSPEAEYGGFNEVPYQREESPAWVLVARKK